MSIVCGSYFKVKVLMKRSTLFQPPERTARRI